MSIDKAEKALKAAQELAVEASKEADESGLEVVLVRAGGAAGQIGYALEGVAEVRARIAREEAEQKAAEGAEA